MSAKAKSTKKPSGDLPLPEEAFDKFISVIEGPLNRGAERVFKSRLFLTPLSLGWTLWARSIIAVRDRDPAALVRGLKKS